MGKVVGLTGGIGSGKTVASDYLESLGMFVVDADVVAREVVEPDSVGLVQIRDQLGSKYISVDGTLDRKALRKDVFNNIKLKENLEAILHPLIRREIELKIQTNSIRNVLLVSPLLFETNQSELCDLTLVVDASKELQILRASSRDSVDKQQIEAIVSSQMAANERKKKATIVIENNGSIEDFKRELKKFYVHTVKR